MVRCLQPTSSVRRAGPVPRGEGALVEEYQPAVSRQRPRASPGPVRGRPGGPAVRKPAFDSEVTSVPGRRAQVQLAAASLHPRLIPRPSSEPVTALRTLPERFPSFAAGTPPTGRRRRSTDEFEDCTTSVHAGPVAALRDLPIARPAARELSRARRQPTRPEPIRPRRARIARPQRTGPAPTRRAEPPPRRAAPVASPQPASPQDETISRPLPDRPATLQTLEIIPASAVRAAPADRTGARAHRGGCFVATIAGLACTIVLTIGPLALVVALALRDPRAPAAALAVPVLAPALAALLATAILRAHRRRGWRPVAILFTLATIAFAVAWAARLSGPVILDLTPADLIADPNAAWLAVRASIPGALELFATPRLLAAWSAEVLLIVAMLLTCARRLRRSRQG